MSAPRQHVAVRLTRRVNDLFLQPSNEHHPVAYPLRATYQGTHGVIVEVEPLSADAAEHHGLVTATVEIHASPRIAEMLRELSERRVPVGTVLPPKPHRWAEPEPLFDAETRILKADCASPPLELLPEGLRSFIDQATSETHDYLERTVRVMRWRAAAEGPHNPFVAVHDGQLFSLDMETWHQLPSTVSLATHLRGSLRMHEPEWNQVTELVGKGGDEPFSFELFREAFSHRFGNLRSAVMLGVAAAENGFKECASQLVPDAEWLIQVPRLRSSRC
jgi:hypothetical protein